MRFSPESSRLRRGDKVADPRTVVVRMDILADKVFLVMGALSGLLYGLSGEYAEGTFWLALTILYRLTLHRHATPAQPPTKDTAR